MEWSVVAPMPATVREVGCMVVKLTDLARLWTPRVSGLAATLASIDDPCQEVAKVDFRAS